MVSEETYMHLCKSKCNITEAMPIVVVGNTKSTLGTDAFPSKNQTTICDLDMGKTPETNTG